MVFQAVILCLPTAHPAEIAFGLASLLGSVYFFYLALETGKRKRMLLHGPVMAHPAPRFERAMSGRGRNERRGLRFLVLCCIIIVLLISLFG